MPRIEDQLERLGIGLPEAPAPIASYIPVTSVHSGALVFVSGQVPLVDGAPMATGQVPNDVSIEMAQRCARQCVINALAALREEFGDLDTIRRVVRVEGFIACGPGFAEQPAVLNGASDLLVELLGGDTGRHARVAVGVSSLPLNVPVEVAFTFVRD